MAFSEGVTKQPENGKLGVDLDNTHTSAEFPVGTTTRGNMGTDWVYVSAAGAITQYNCVGISEDFAAAPITKAMADDGYHIGFAQVAIASGSYGWVATRGSDIGCLVQPGTTVDSTLYIGANSAGVLDSNSSGGTNIDGIVPVAAGDSGGGSITSVEVMVTYPRSTTF